MKGGKENIGKRFDLYSDVVHRNSTPLDLDVGIV